ncbi:MAG: helix-turn-helix domain-containing protein [Janthinobacterium lividum]
MERPDLTTGDVATELQINPLTVQRYLREGQLPGYRLGTRWRVTREALDAFKARRTTLTPGRPRAPRATTPKRPVGRPRKCPSPMLSGV